MNGSDLIHGWWLGFALDIVVKATLILALGSLWTIRAQTPAAVRHRIWFGTFVALAILPAAILYLPNIALSILPSGWSSSSLAWIDNSSSSLQRAPEVTVDESAAGQSESMQSEVEGSAESTNTEVFNTPIISPSSQGQPKQTSGLADQSSKVESTKLVPKASETRLPLGVVVVGVWLAGVIVTLMPVLAGVLSSYLFARTGKLASDHPLQKQVDQLSKLVGIVRVPRLYLSDSLQMPMIMGIWQSMVILPSTAATWPKTRAKSVLLHELAHIRRHDVLLQLIVRCICSLYWFHPMAWWAIGKMRMDREFACDDCALQAGCEATEYANELLGIAREYKTRSYYASAALSMARISQLEGRLLAVLDGSRMRQTSSGRANIAVVAMIGCVALLLGTLQLESRASIQANAPQANERMIIEGIVRTEAREPATGAKIEYIVHDHPGGNHFAVPAEEKVDRFETFADENGRFHLEVPRYVSDIPNMSAIIASLEGQFPVIEQIDPRKPLHNIGMQFLKSKIYSVEILGGTGPVSGLSPKLEYVQHVGGESLQVPHPLGHAAIASWPEVKAGDGGSYDVRLPELISQFNMSIDSPYLEPRLLTISLASMKAPYQVKVDYPNTLAGTVNDQMGNPVKNVKIVTNDRFYREARTDENGKFRINHGSDNHLYFYPPAESDLLYRVVEWGSEKEQTFVLEKGVILEGQIIDKKTLEPIVGAQLSYQFDRESNQYGLKNMRSSEGSMEPRFVSDQDGKFRMSVPSGKGRLQMRQPNFDYLLTSKIDAPWMSGPAFRGMVYDKEFDLAADAKPETLKIELERGERVTLQVQRPDGSVSKCVAMTPTYRFFEPDMPSMMPFESFNGAVELPGSATASSDVLLVDMQGSCGAIIQAPEHADGPVAVKLNRFGKAKLTVLDTEGKPKVGYTPTLRFGLRGIPASAAEQANTPAPREPVTWGQFSYTQLPISTDKQGVAKLDLIPGILYTMYYADERGAAAQRDFVLTQDQELDLGRIVVNF